MSTPRVYAPSSTWGRAIGWQKLEHRLVGWLSPLPNPGDEFHSPMQSGRTGVYRITKVDPCWDPSDMFFADVKWKGYADDLNAPVAAESSPSVPS